MIEQETGGPAFPMPGMTGLPNGDFVYGEQGMTLRDYFAAKAMQGLLSDTRVQAPVEEFALNAYKIADAMLAARKGETS